MKELLLGPWFKPQLELTEIDKLIQTIEFFIGIIIIIAICMFAEMIIEEFKKRKKNK